MTHQLGLPFLSKSGTIRTLVPINPRYWDWQTFLSLDPVGQTMILTIALLLLFQLAGVVISALTGAPVPGAVIGMLLFLFALMTVRGLLQKTLPVVNVLLAHFALLFVPAGVGIIEYKDLLLSEWLPIGAAILGSSILAMTTTVLVTRLVMKLSHIQ